MRCAGKPRTSKGTAIAPLRTAGIAVGLALAAVLVLAFRVPASSQELGAGVRIAAQAPGELHVPDGGAFLAARGLMAGGEAARASLPVENVTRGPVNVRLRTLGGGHDLDRSLHLELRADGRRLAAGPLARLRSWSRAVRIERGGEQSIRARAWIPAGAEDTAGRRVALQLQLDADLVKASLR
jgi:hypothetical protein